MKSNYDKNKIEKYAENYWKKNGFDYEVKRKYMSKTVYIIRKDGLEFPYEVPDVVQDCKLYMQWFQEQFEMRKQIAELQKS